MKSVAIFLTLVFLTGFQAAVLSEEPPPSIEEPNQSVLEQMQEQFRKVSTQVTESINGGLDAIKESASDFVAYTTEWGKKYNPQKLLNRKMQYLAKDLYQYGNSVYNQGTETLKGQYKKAVEAVGEMKKHPTAMTLNEEVVQPLLARYYKLLNWFGDQSIASMSNMVQKKLSF